MKRKGPRVPHIPRTKHPTVVKKRLRKYWGWANNKRHEIEIDEKLTGRAKMEAMVHEWLHLHSWALPEDAVRKTAHDLVTFLHKNNMRLVEPGDKPLDFD